VKEIVGSVVIAMACVVVLENKSWSQQEKTVVTVLHRNEKIFKEWATSLRMSSDVSKTKPKYRRAAYLSQAMQAKENKLMSKYKISQYQLFVIVRQGAAEEWPTEKPTDINIVKPIIAQCQANLDSFMFEKDMYEWVDAHASRPPIRSFSATYSLAGFSSALQQAALDGAATDKAMQEERNELRRNAPIHPCGKTVNGAKCQRKVVGEPGRLCYEHRD